MTKSDVSVTTPKVSWSSAGSSKNRNDAWLGGVTMAAVGEAAKRQQQEVVDCRKWGRYLGRIYRGKNKKTMVVVQVYFPDAQYSSTSNAESYSQLLGVKAAAVTQGTPAGRWRLGMAPPKPDTAQLQHPRLLLMADLETHLMHYALDPNCTLVLMGDMNIDLCTRDDDDGPALRLMMTRLGLISCAEARWPDSHQSFLTHRAGEGQAHSHIDYIFITESQAASVRRFGVDADATLMHDFDHAVLFADVDVVRVLGLTSEEEVVVPKRRRSEIRYSDKQGLERFRTFAEQLYEKRGFEAKMQDLIGDVELDERLRQQGEDDRKERERRGWDAVHWRYGTGSTGDEGGIRWRIDEAMALLDEMATAADVGFAETHGGQKRKHDKSNPKRCGAGYSPCTAEAAKDCTRFRRMIKAVWRERWEEVRTSTRGTGVARGRRASGG